MKCVAFWIIFGLGIYTLVNLLFGFWDLFFGGGAEEEWCEGCGVPATQHDLDGVPLCDECAKLDGTDSLTECPACGGTLAKHASGCPKHLIDSGEAKP